METKTTALPKLFIGLDIHKKSWSVHFRTDICEHKTLTMPSEPQILSNYLETNFADHKVSLVYESSCCGFSASRYFLNLGWEVLVVNPADIPRMNKQSFQKTDKIDCRNLAKQLQAGQLRGIYIPTEDQDYLKSLLRQRARLTRQLRDAKSAIKSLLLYSGFKVPEQYDNPNWSKEFLNWISKLNWPYDTGKLCMESKLRMYGYIYQEYLQLSNQL